MNGIGGFTQQLPRLHSWGLSPSRTALLILRFLWAIPRGVLTQSAYSLKTSFAFPIAYCRM
jgi:hypothetical protein